MRWRPTHERRTPRTDRWCFNRDTNLWHHLGHPEGPDLESAPWGRGNGWMLYGIRGLLEDLPASHPARPALCRMLAEELEGLLNFQDEQGLWRNVIDAPPAYSRQDSCITWIINDRVWAGLVERVAAG